MVIDSELLRKNCKEYKESHYKSADVLRELNGKQSYQSISKKLKIPSCKVSSLQKKANELGLANKCDNGFYKKVPGILGYMPKNTQHIVEQKTTGDLIQKVKKIQQYKPILSSFTPSTRVSNAFEKMTIAYRHLYLTENILRDLIRKIIGSQQDWWIKRVPPTIQSAVSETIQTTPYHAAKRMDELEYAHLGQLKEIITWKVNWKDFQPYLNEQNINAFQVTIDRAIPSRNSIGHCIPLEPPDIKIIDVRFEDILKMIK